MSFLSYSLEHIIEDLEKMLYHENIFPWNDGKYAKRVNRLFYLSFIELFRLLNNNESRKFYIINMKQYFQSIIDKNKEKKQKYFSYLQKFELSELEEYENLYHK